MWWDFDEGDTPSHLYTVMNFLDIPFVLELSGDQFVRDGDRSMKDRIKLGAYSKQDGPFVDLGIVIIPVAELQAYDWPYVGGETYLVRDQREALLRVLNDDEHFLELLTSSSPRLKEGRPEKGEAKDGGDLGRRPIPDVSPARRLRQNITPFKSILLSP